MKTFPISIVAICISFFPQENRSINSSIPHVEVLNLDLPIKLDEINFQDENLVEQISYGKMAGIEKVIRNYYFEDCHGDEKETDFSMDNIYFKTIKFQHQEKILFWVILIHYPTGKVNSKLLFFNQRKFDFVDHSIDFNLHAMYDFEKNNLTPSNLKTQFKIKIPEIELIDFDKNGEMDYKLTRLYHNGTSNAIEETILNFDLEKNKIDSLYFNRKWIKN